MIHSKQNTCQIQGTSVIKPTGTAAKGVLRDLADLNCHILQAQHAYGCQHAAPAAHIVYATAASTSGAV